MSQDPRIEAAARQVAVENGYPDFMYPDGMAGVHAKSCREKAARIIAAADKFATIENREQLDTLPNESVIIDDAGYPYRRAQSGPGHLGEWEGTELGDFLGVETIDYPARVIHWGTE